ncbi:type VII toxin-antitoxin system MntA family adenylyltransferase antitoxin [Candidatus Darwinibacter acetoxidans]|jgi:predicted nucleotidyltransferase|nr:nucleotidyltransferase domain-containing protein [Bacillota bacterium]
MSLDFSGVIHYAQHHDRIMALYLVGSYGTGYHTPLSDIDFAVISRESLGFAEQAAILTDFMDILGRDDVDIIFLPGAGLVLQHKVLSEGTLLYNRDEVFLADFVEYTIKYYCDFQIDLNQFYRDYDLGLLEEYGHDRT